MVGGLPGRRIVLEHRGNSVGDGAGDAEEDDGNEAVADVVVERRGVDRVDHKKFTGVRRESHSGPVRRPRLGPPLGERPLGTR